MMTQEPKSDHLLSNSSSSTYKVSCPEQKSQDFIFLNCKRTVKLVFTSKDYSVIK